MEYLFIFLAICFLVITIDNLHLRNSKKTDNKAIFVLLFRCANIISNSNSANKDSVLRAIQEYFNKNK